jgi:hypothetical protein
MIPKRHATPYDGCTAYLCRYDLERCFCELQATAISRSMQIIKQAVACDIPKCRTNYWRYAKLKLEICLCAYGTKSHGGAVLILLQIIIYCL